jgi:tetratricopeptide (TPR) repeat protein
MDALAALYRNEKKLSDAEMLLKQAVEGRRRVLGEHHLDTLVSLNNMGLLYLEQHRYSEAETLFNELLEERRRALGPDHPDTIGVWYSLGRLRLEQQQYAEAEAPLREALAHQQNRNLGAVRHPEHARRSAGGSEKIQRSRTAADRRL